MSETRWRELMEFGESTLTPEEISEGWHFCTEWDDLLVGPGMDEMESCQCADGKPLVKTQENP